MTLEPDDHVIVVGAGLAGWRFAESLRREGFDGALTLVGDEPEVPYDRPPLSKQVLAGRWDLEMATLATPERLAAARVSLRLGTPARHLDVSTTTVHLEDGTAVAGTHVVIATGVAARRLAFAAEDGVHYLRTHADLRRLLAQVGELAAGRTVAVIGAGFIGAEVATALATRGLHPVVLEQARLPLLGVLGETVAEWLADLPARAGVEFRGEQRVDDVVEDTGEMAVRMAGGDVVRAALVVVGVGTTPNVGWLATSGLTIDDGVVVDEHLVATERVAAIGDVARFTWRGPRGARLMRVEHWQVAADHASDLARFWARGASGPPMVPYFWSDQYGRKIQLLGHPDPRDDVVRVAESEDGSRWLALYVHEGVVTGVVGLNQPRQLTLSRPLIESATRVDEALARAPWGA